MCFFMGIGIGFIIFIGYFFIVDMFEEFKRGRGYVYMEMVFGFGMFFGMIMVGMIVGWRFFFILVVVFNFIFVLFFYFIVEEFKRGEGEKEF